MKLNLNKFLPNEFQKSLGSEKGYEKNKYLPGFLQNFALASRHFSMAWREKNLHLGERIGHTFIGIVECIPLLGNLIGIGEKRLFSKNVDNPTTEKTKSVASSILKQSQKTTASINKSATSLSSNKNIAISSTKTTEQTDNSLSETVQQKKRVHWPDEQTSGQNSLRGFNEKEAFKCFLQDYFKEICSEGNRSQIFYEKTTGKKLCDIGADGNLLAITEEGEEFLKNRGIFPSSEQSKELETIYDISPPPNTRTESNSATISTLTEKSELLKSETRNLQNSIRNKLHGRKILP